MTKFLHRRKTASHPSEATSDSPHICIVGGGFGGLYCALALQRYLGRLPHPVRVTLIEPRDRFTFTPLLYELLTDELKPWEIAPTYKELLGHTQVEIRSEWVAAIDLIGKTVHLHQGGSLPYDYLVVALGSRLRPPTVAGSQDFALPFATLEDEWALERQLTNLESQPEKRLIHAVVAGAGPSGVELACKLADRLGSRGRITVLERRSVILRSYPEPIQKAASHAFRKRGIDFHTHASIDEVTADTVTYQRDGQTYRLQTDLILWTVGTVPQPWIGKEPGNQNQFGQCLVRPTLQYPDYSEVFVLGDMAQMPAVGRDRAPMTAQAAFQAAPIVAHNLWALMANRPLKPFKYHHLGDMMTLGRGEAVVNGFGLCITGRLGAFSRRWAYWLRLPTMGHRLRVLKYRVTSAVGIKAR